MSRLQPLEVKAGAVVFFGAFLVHRSLPNRSDVDRRALLYSYQPAGISARARDQPAQATGPGLDPHELPVGDVAQRLRRDARAVLLHPRHVGRRLAADRV